MAISGIVSLLVVGAVVGGLGRLVVPGQQFIPIWLTILVGVVASFAGELLASSLGLADTPGIDWLALTVQVVFAAIGVVIAVNLYARRGVRYRRSISSGSERRQIDEHVPPRAYPVPPWTPAATPTPTVVREARPQPGPRIEVPRPDPVPPAPPPEPSRRPSRIFVSYRRVDEWPQARLVVEHLRTIFTRDEVFMDVDSIHGGADFVEVIRSAVRASAVVLVLIGSRWTAVKDASGRCKLDDPNDFVRMEIEYALSLDKVVVPVLVDNAVMPHVDQVPDALRPLLRLNAVHIRHVSWDRDIEDLVRGVRSWRSWPGASPHNPLF